MTRTGWNKKPKEGYNWFMANNIPVQVVINAVDNASKVFSSVGTGISGMGKSITNLNQGQTALAGGMAALGAAAGLMSQSFVSVAGDMEQNKVAFEVMLRSADKAKVMLQDLTSFAARTPFNLQGVVEAGKQLLAYGFAQEEVITTTEMLGNVASGLKIPLGDIIYLFGTLRAQGRAYTKDLNQFTARGIPILDELAKQYGITTAEVFKYAETGRIGFADVEKAFQNMTKEGGQFFNLMDRQSQTTLGRLSNFEDSVYQLKGALGEALLPAVNELITNLIPLIKGFSGFAKENPKIVAGFLAITMALGALGATVLALGPIFAGIGAVISMVTASWGAIVTVIGGVAAFLTGPIGIALIAIIGLIGLLTTAWLNNWGGIRDITQQVIEYLTPAFNTVIASIQQMILWVTQIPEAWNSAVASIQQVGANISLFFTTLIEQFKAIPEAIGIMLVMLTETVYNFFVWTLPMAVGFTIAAFEKFIFETLPQVQQQFIRFFSEEFPKILQDFGSRAIAIIQSLGSAVINTIVSMGASVTNTLTWMRDNGIAVAISMRDQVIQWMTDMVSNSKRVVDTLPGLILSAFNSAKNNAIEAARSLYDGVQGWMNRVKQLFEDIISAAQRAIDTARQAFSIGQAQGKRQFGGPVSATSSYLVGEDGPEIFTPSTAGNITPNSSIGKGGGGPVIQFIINAENIINSPNERRGLAEALLTDLRMLARSQNLSVSEYLEGS